MEELRARFGDVRIEAIDKHQGTQRKHIWEAQAACNGSRRHSQSDRRPNQAWPKQDERKTPSICLDLHFHLKMHTQQKLSLLALSALFAGVLAQEEVPLFIPRKFAVSLSLQLFIPMLLETYVDAGALTLSIQDGAAGLNGPDTTVGHRTKRRVLRSWCEGRSLEPMQIRISLASRL